jgi:hypothetical protein
MQIETVGKYQIHLFAYELPVSGQWDPFVTILEFNDEAKDFICIVDRHHAAETAFATYDEAIDQARRVGTAMIEARQE